MNNHQCVRKQPLRVFIIAIGRSKLQKGAKKFQRIPSYYPIAIKWLPPRLGFGGSDVHKPTLVDDETNKEDVPD